MANFSQGFTGKDTAITLPSNEGVQRAQQGLNAMITQAEEIRYKTWKDNRDQFLKNASIDPVFVLSDSARKSQMSLINNFNKKWGKKAQETNYNFTEQDRQDMLTEKNFIISEAQNQQAQMQRFLQHRDMVSKDIQGLYDTNAFGEAMDRYMETGIYDLSRPPLKALSPSSYLSGMANKETGEYIMGDKTDQVTMPSGQVAYRTFNIDPKSVGDWLAPKILSMPEQYQLGMVKEWADLPQPEKDKWLNMADTNQDKQIDEGEKKNAILEWAKDRYARDVLKPKLSTPKGVTKGGDKSSIIAPAVNVSGATIKLQPGQRVQEPVVYSDQTYSKYSFAFGDKTPLYGIRTKGAKVLHGDWSEEDEAAGSVNARLVLYDPIKHAFVIELHTGSESADMKTRVLLEIPENNIQNYENIPLRLDNSTIYVGDYKKTMSSASEGNIPQATSTTPTGNSLKERMAKLKGQ